MANLSATFNITNTELFKSLLEANVRILEDERVSQEHKEAIQDIWNKVHKEEA